MEKNVNYSKTPIDAFLGFKTDAYGLPFDRARGYAVEVIKRLESKIGWKSGFRRYDFTGVAGRYLAVPDGEFGNEFVFMKDGKAEARFFATEDGRLGYEALGDFFASYGEDPNPWYILGDLMDGKYLLDKENVELLKAETHGGNEVIFGITYGDATAICANRNDTDLCRQLADRMQNIRFVTLDKLTDSLTTFMDMYAASPGFEPEFMPEKVMFLYDGQTLRSEEEMVEHLAAGKYADDNVELVMMRHASDWEAIHSLRDEFERMRCDLDQVAGVPEVAGHFKFSFADVPCSMISPDCVGIVSSRGRLTSEVYTVVGGRVCFVEPQFNKAGEPHLTELSCSPVELVDSIRDKIFSEDNISMAREEWKEYEASQEVKKGKGLSI